MEELTAFQRDLMYVTAGTDSDEPHGLALKEALEDYRHEKINNGRLYPKLDTLVDKGLLSKGSIDRRTNSYQLTRRGLREINARHDWINEQVSGDRTIADLDEADD